MRILADKLGRDTHLLAYGTLFFPEVIEALLGRVPASSPCRAHDCRRYAILDRVYPQLALARGHTLDDHVCLYSTLSAADWRVLDRFEDPRYDLVEVLTDRGPAMAYASRADRMRRAGPWDPSAFEAEHLADYLTMCRTWRRKLEASDWLRASE